MARCSNEAPSRKEDDKAIHLAGAPGSSFHRIAMAAGSVFSEFGRDLLLMSGLKHEGA